MMFEVGREYMFTTGTGGQEATWWGEILEVSLPLIKVTGSTREIVINTSSPSFVSAEIQPHRSPEQKEAERIKWDGLINTPKGSDVA
jgi:hypothetical protein